MIPEKRIPPGRPGKHFTTRVSAADGVAPGLLLRSLVLGSWVLCPLLLGSVGCTLSGDAERTTDGNTRNPATEMPEPPEWLAAARPAEGKTERRVRRMPERRKTQSFDWFSDERQRIIEETVIQLDVRADVAREVNRHEAIRRGALLYRRACATCHGRRGNGHGLSAPGLATEPADLTGGVYMNTSGDDDRLDQDLFKILSDGLGRDMPGWKKLLSPDDRWKLVAFLRTL